MPRELVIGNGSLLITFDRTYTMVDLYFPHVGQENHGGRPWRFGVWTEGRFAWTSDDGWRRSLHYQPETLVTDVRLDHAELGLTLHCEDAVDFGRPLYIKRVRVTNHSGHAREVRLFFQVDPRLWGNTNGDTVYFDPTHRALLAYKGMRYVWLCGMVDGKPGLTTFATGHKEQPGLEGTWRDAEDGELSGHPIAQGSVDGVGSLSLTVPAGGTAEAHFWLIVGQTYNELRDVEVMVRQRGPASYLERTANYWRVWANNERVDFADLPPQVVALYKQSLLILRTHLDDSGAVIAACDSDILQFGRDTYDYMWPRDGALVASALIHAGYAEAARSFFAFCCSITPGNGALLHKYNPDGSPGSSWHPWSSSDETLQLPIQEDETALVLWALWAYFERFRNVELLITAAADFLLRYRDAATGLPAPSYDLWEERRGILAFTTAAVWAGLRAAADFADLFNEDERAASYRHAADEIRAATLKHLYDPERGSFARMVEVLPDGTVRRDPTCDASVAGLFQFGMFGPGDEPMAKTMAEVEARLWCRTAVGGVARYENDYYHQVSQDLNNVPGNPWIICTLWLADWHVARASTLADLSRARSLLLWVEGHARPSGVLAEQVHPYTGEPLSVSPLTWSHGAFVTTVHNYLNKLRQLQDAPPGAGMYP
ncbi:MAG: glycoside hydrolase family 15 protein [Chloroflexi bacterium]|nr:glycoside hydrolase family 15 protein [Chloroflexota bacterium]